MTKKTKETKETRIPLSEISRELENSFLGADRARTTHLVGLQRVRGAKSAGLEREHQRLSRSLGDRHPRVVALSDKIAVNAALSRQLVYESERAKVETPTPEARGYIVHGHVRDQDLNAVPGLTVALYDPSGKWLRRLGFDCTDQTGHFKLCYDAGAKDQPEPKPGERDYLLHISDKKSTLLHRHPRAVQPALGRVDYREIILGEEADCPPPEPTPGSDTVPRPEPDRPAPDRPAPNRPGLNQSDSRPRSSRGGRSGAPQGGEAEDTGVKPKRRTSPRTAAGSKNPAAAKKPSSTRKKRK
jgi:hypothetical protein